MIFSLSQNDIDHGVRLKCRKCPVARCMGRRFPKAIVEVYGAGAILSRKDEPHRMIGSIDLPERVERWVADFDRGRDVKPIRFEAHVDGSLVMEYGA